MTDTKLCPFCAEEIRAAAIKCRYCESDLGPDLGGEGKENDSSILAMSPIKMQDASLCSSFEIECSNGREQFIAFDLFFFEVRGLIRNTSTRPRSFHITVFGRRLRDGVLYNLGLCGLTETPVLLPGQSDRWITKIVTTGGAPDSLRYQVQIQTALGEIGTSDWGELENPEPLGDLWPLAASQVAGAVRAWDVAVED